MYPRLSVSWAVTRVYALISRVRAITSIYISSRHRSKEEQDRGFDLDSSFAGKAKGRCDTTRALRLQSGMDRWMDGWMDRRRSANRRTTIRTDGLAALARQSETREILIVRVTIVHRDRTRARGRTKRGLVFLARLWGKAPGSSRAFIKNDASRFIVSTLFLISPLATLSGVARTPLPGLGFNINADEIEILISIQSWKVLSAAGFHRVTVS